MIAWDYDLDQEIEQAEAEFNAKVIRMDNGEPGGMCRCCGGGPIAEPSWRGTPWFIFRSNVVDEDGEYYSMLCEGCLVDMRDMYGEDKRAELISDLLGDDVDDAQVEVQDFLEYTKGDE